MIVMLLLAHNGQTHLDTTYQEAVTGIKVAHLLDIVKLCSTAIGNKKPAMRIHAGSVNCLGG